MKFRSYLCAAILLLVPLAVHGGSPSEFGKLLMELEQQTKLASQYPTWSDKRDGWKTTVSSATSVRVLAQPLIDFELSIKTEAQDESWRARREAWIVEVRAAQNLNTLVDLLLELETPIKWETLEATWRTRRDSWRAEVTALKNSTSTTVSPGGASIEFGKLLLELEQKTQTASQYPAWSDKRASWVASTRSATGVRDLAQALIDYELSVKTEAQNESWRSRREAWIRDVRAAQNLMTLVDLLLEMETPIKWEALGGDTWRARRDAWRAEVTALKNFSSPAAVSSALARTEFGKLLLELEQQTRLSAQLPSWPGYRDDFLASSNLGGALGMFGISIKWEFMSESWPDRLGRILDDRSFTDGWMREASAPRNLNHLVDLLLELEAACKWEVTEETWRARRDAWRAEVTALKNFSAPPTTASPATASPAGAKTAFGRLLLELRQQTRLTALVPSAPENWEKWQAARRLESGQDLGMTMVLFGTSIKVELMSEAWLNRMGRRTDDPERWTTFTDGWIHEAISASTTNLNTLVDLLIELEGAMKWEVTEETWRARRDGWLAEVRALKS